MQRPLDAAHGRIFVYRNPSFVGAGLTPHLSLDGVDKGVLHVKRVFVFDVTAGPHVLEIAGSRPGYPFPSMKVEVDVHDDQVLYYRYQAEVVGMSSQGIVLVKDTTRWRYALSPVAPKIGAAEVEAMVR